MLVIDGKNNKNDGISTMMACVQARKIISDDGMERSKV
jgi:hypothetical protein